MMELLTAAQMRAIEQAAIDSGVVTGLELMERAGRGVVEAIFEWRPDLLEGERSAVVLCGPGNNGGDGFVVARLLKERGWAVEVFLYGDEAKLPPDAAENARRWQGIGEINPINAFFSAQGPIEDICIDALFGTGLTSPLSGDAARAVSHMAGCYAFRCVCVDIASGVCADSGHFLSKLATSHMHPYPELTVTFHSRKLGHMIGTGPQYCGKLAVVDLGLESNEERFDRLMNIMPLREFDAWRDNRVLEVEMDDLFIDGFHWIDKNPSTHKFHEGHTLVLSGGMGRSGAARLAARGALRIGAGVVTVLAPADAMMECAAQLTAIMLRELGGAEGLSAMLSDARINAVCLGPGLGLGKQTRELVAVACGREPQPRQDSRGLDGQRDDHQGPGSSPGLRDARSVVLDADALTSFADDPPALFALLHDRCVLTPHEGEFGRLFPDILEKLKAPATTGPAYSKVDATREAAARAGCVVLFKGADTVIADPSGRCAINSAHYERAAPWLATAGSGDVLAGIIIGLLARGLDPMSAAESAAWLHVEAGRTLGPGLIAEDIPEALPRVLKQLLDWKPPINAPEA